MIKTQEQVIAKLVSQPCSGFPSICPGCRNGATLPFFQATDIPVNCSALWQTKSSAQGCVRGDICLAFCQNCGLVFNQQFDPELLEYNTQYDNSLDFSPSFQAYSYNLSRRLRETYHLQGKRIIGIGCGRGEFLKRLCQNGENFGMGFDPSFDGELEGTPGVRFVRDYYSEAYLSEPVDFVCCRHVLEHIPQPLQFLSSLRNILVGKGDVTVYFEVPNAWSVLAGSSLWDIIYPHVSYFTSDVLQSLFVRAGFEVLQAGTTFSDEFVYLEARVAPETAPVEPLDFSELKPTVEAFSRRFQDTVSEWFQFLKSAAQHHYRVAFWGAGAKSVNFLNLVSSADRIEAIVDSNPRKQGMYTPGTGQQILSPEGLKWFQPDLVVTLNPVYVKEIASTLASLKIDAEVLSHPDNTRISEDHRNYA